MQFSALCKQYRRKYQPSKTTKLLGGKKLVSHTFFVKFRVFKREFLWNHSVYRANIFRDNWNCYAFLIISSSIPLTYSDNEKHALMRPKNVNKHSPIGVAQLLVSQLFLLQSTNKDRNKALKLNITLRIPTGRRQASQLLTRAAEDLKSGLQRTN